MAWAAGSRSSSRSLSWAVLAALSVTAALQPAACSPDEGNGNGGLPDTTEAAIGAALADVGPVTVLPALDAFLSEAASLEAAAASWSASGGAEAERAAAVAQWRATMRAWQALEVMQIGPAASSLTAVAGADVRDEIYSWPVVNPCRVDQETVLAEWDDPDFFTERLVNSYGLDALEHLLSAGPDNACPGQVDINAEGSWDALAPEEIQQRRAEYAAALAAHVLARGQALRALWAPEEGNFSGALALEEGVTSPYASSLEALNAVFDALFYLELRTKDDKLAIPMGLQDCDAATCPEAVELAASGESAAAIAANLEGFQALFAGGADGSGQGLDDLLVALGHGDLSQEILAGLEAARGRAQALEDTGVPLAEALTSHPEEVSALYDAIKAVADLLKGDLATVLSLEIPSEAAGDND